MAISVSNGYDAANILFEGIRLANSTDPKAVIAAIESIKDYQGVNTAYTFSKERHHGIETDGVKVFEYVKKGDKIRLRADRAITGVTGPAGARAAPDPATAPEG